MTLRYPLVLLAMLNLPSMVMAGAEGLIVNMPLESMQQRGLIHLELQDGSSHPLSGVKLKAARVSLNSCTAAALTLGHDYHYGYYPSPKKVGLILPANVWQNNTLCIQLPDHQPLLKRFDESAVAQSLSERLHKAE